MRLILKDKISGDVRCYQSENNKRVKYYRLREFIQQFFAFDDFVITYFPIRSNQEYGLSHEEVIDCQLALNNLMINNCSSSFVKLYIKPIEKQNNNYFEQQSLSKSKNYKKSAINHEQSLHQNIVDKYIEQKVNYALQSRLSNMVGQQIKSYIQENIKPYIIIKTETNNDNFTSKNKRKGGKNYERPKTQFSRSRFLSVPSQSQRLMNSTKVSKYNRFLQGSTDYQNSELYLQLSRKRTPSRKQQKSLRRCRCKSINKYTTEAHYGFNHSQNEQILADTEKQNRKKRLKTNLDQNSQSLNYNSSILQSSIHHKNILETHSRRQNQKNNENLGQKKDSPENNSLKFLKPDIMSMQQKGKIFLKMQQIFGEEKKSKYFCFIEENQSLKDPQKIIDKWIEDHHF